MTSAKKKIILVVACLAQFMVVLDLAIVNVALPTIKLDLGLSQSTLQWIVIAYGLTLGGFLLLGGRLGDLIGRRRVLLTGLVLFSASSLVAGLAHSIQLLIASRAVEGFGAALMAPTALSIVAHTFAEGRERNSALGIYGAIGGASGSVGVIASGILTDGPGWRWVFFINIPIGIALIALAAVVLPKDKPETATRQFDTLGAAAVTAGLLTFVYAINKGSSYGWSSFKTIGLFVISAIFIAAFAKIESRSRSPLVPGSVFKNRNLIAANASAFLIFGSFFAFIFLGTLFMQQQFGYTPLRTGVAWLASSVTAFVAAGLTGAKLVDKFGVKRMLLLGASCMVIAMLLLVRTPIHASYVSDLLPGFILAGFGIGFAAPTLQVAALAKAKSEELGLASGLIEMMREIGGAVAIASVSAVLVAKMASSSGASAASRQLTSLHAFHTSLALLAGIATAGLLVVLGTFPRSLDADVATMDINNEKEALAVGETEI